MSVWCTNKNMEYERIELRFPCLYEWNGEHNFLLNPWLLSRCMEVLKRSKTGLDDKTSCWSWTSPLSMIGFTVINGFGCIITEC